MSATILPPAPINAPIVLASNSPRRRELLSLLVPEFTLAPSRSVDESFDASIPASQVPVVLSQIKSTAYSDLATAGAVLITADTVVICDGRIMGKPATRDEAVEMLRALSGRQHTVVTGVTLRQGPKIRSFAETTIVNFAELSDAEISEYVDSSRPYDKAGAYGIQEWIGCIGITGIQGCYYNVMGLPLHHLYQALRAL